MDRSDSAGDDHGSAAKLARWGEWQVDLALEVATM